MTPETILFATDLSCRCDRALDRAAMLATEWKAKLVVAHVLQEAAEIPPLPAWRRPQDPRQTALQRILDDLPEKRGFDLEVFVERGDPAPVIQALAERTGCGLILTGVARDETLGRVFLGSTVENLARIAKVPVLVVKSRPRGIYRNIAVATDFSVGSRRALDTVLDWLPEARISLFHAWRLPFEGLIDNPAKAREDAEGQAETEARRFLAAVPGIAARENSIEVFSEYGTPDALLPEMARAKRFDLVALGSNGRSQLVNGLLGSVAHRMLETLSTDVLVTRGL